MRSILLSSILLIGGLFSCNTLETEPTDFIAPQFYYNDETQLNNALTSVYAVLGNADLYGCGAGGLVTGFNVTDEMFRNTTTLNIPDNYDYFSTNVNVSNIWTGLYQGIERANMLLANIDKPQLSDAKRKVIEGQARFLRAYFYFDLVKNFGDVPLRIKPTASVTDISHTRNQSREVYEFILQEMEAAEALVEPITVYNQAGRITKSAVQGILARVNLQMAGEPLNEVSRYGEALKWAQKVIDSGLHALNPSYSQVFINVIQDKYEIKESIWEIEFFITGASDAFLKYGGWGATNGIVQRDLTLGASGGPYQTHIRQYNRYEESDVRRDWAIAAYRYNSAAPNAAPNDMGSTKLFWKPDQIIERRVGKWRREYELTAQKVQNFTTTNFSILRFSDVLLMAAEAENQVNGPTAKAFNYLNLVRTRAKASPIANTLGKDAFLTVIQEERARELCFEGFRRNDLIRWGIFVPFMQELAREIRATNLSGYQNAARAGESISEKHIFFPIPLRELTLNKSLTQNPGW